MEWRYTGALRWFSLPALVLITAVRNLLNRLSQAIFRSAWSLNVSLHVAARRSDAAFTLTMLQLIVLRPAGRIPLRRCNNASKFRCASERGREQEWRSERT